MSATKPWIESVHLHPDVLRENAGTDIFALDLGPLADGSGAVAPVYRDAESFFRASFVTTGLKSLLDEVLKRLAGKAGAPVLKLITPFGGGKSHVMAALLHAAKNHKALAVLPEAKGMPNPGTVRVAVIDGQFFNAQQGKESDGMRTLTLWGWIALKLGGKAGYELIRVNDEKRGTPGGDDLLQLFGDQANLVLLDEVLEYLINAGGIKVEKTDLREQTLIFLKELTVAAANAPRTVVVLSLPSSQPRETMQHTQLLATVDHFVGRKDTLREPVEADEVFKVIQRRLLEKMPDPAVASATATAYQEVFTQMRQAWATTPAEEEQADEEGIALRNRIKLAYPFHPALLDLMRQRWASLPEYQRTRGALRFLAACLRAQHKAGKSNGLLTPGDVMLSDHEVRRALIKELELMNRFDAVFEADLTGTNARARKIDQRRAKENPAEVGKNVAQRIATAIFLYSFGGLRRENGGKSEALPPGVSEPDLLGAVVGPDLDSLTVKAVLAELRQQCLYLHFDGVRYCFKQDPNVTLLIEQEADAVSRDEKIVTTTIREMLEKRLAGNHAAIAWPQNSGEIPDQEPRFQLAYLPLEFGTKTSKEQESTARELFEKHGTGPRKFRNGIGLAIPASDQAEVLRKEVRYIVAIERVRYNAKKLNITKEQGDELRERERTAKSGAESAFLKLYSEVWLPKLEGGAISVEKLSVGGRPLQVTVNETHEALIFERGLELLMQVQPRVFDKLAPRKIVELFKIGEGGSTPGLECKQVVEGLFSFLGFARLLTANVISKSIVRGIQEGVFGYFSGPTPTLGEDGKFQVARDRVRFQTTISEDEVDFDSGFLMLPNAIPAAPAPGITPGITAPGLVPPEPSPTGQQPPSTDQLQTTVDLSFAANRDQLFAAWNAIANLADMSGEVNVTIHAEKAEGFDKSKLQNGVIEPLRESDLLE
jgi:hypothetical protein